MEDTDDNCGWIEFVWSPSSHRWVAHKHLAFQQTMIQLLMIRNTLWEHGTVPWLPNELMFEIFRALFDVSPRHQVRAREPQRHGNSRRITLQPLKVL